MTITTKTIILTPSLAHKYLANMVHNRPVSEKTVERYAREITDGKWCLTGQGLIFDANGLMLDGQHRCLAVIKSNKSIEILYVYGIDEKTFSRMDVGNKRTVADVIGCKNSTTTAAALKYIHREMVGGGMWWNTNLQISPYRGVQILEQHPAIESSVECARGFVAARKFINTGNLSYCHYRAKAESPGDCAVFFAGLDSGAEIGSRSPILALRNALMPSPGSTYKNEHQIALFILAWNCFLKRGSVKFLRIPSDMPKWNMPL